MREFTITSDNSGQRLLKYLVKLMPSAGQGFLFKMLRKKNITLNEKKATGKESLKTGDTVKVFFSDETFNKFAKSDINAVYKDLSLIDFSNLDVVFKDSEKLVVNKPFGMLSQKSTETDISVNEIAISYLINNGLSLEEFKTYKPSVVNRLDRNTGGLITIAITRPQAVRLTEGIRNKSVRRIYNVIVLGEFKNDGVICGYYHKDEASNTADISLEETDGWDLVKTRFKLLNYNKNFSLVECELLTGKSHQIRAMMKALSHPVLGDNKYGDSMLNSKLSLDLPGQYLFAKEVIFPNGERVTADLPKEFKRFF